MKTKRTASTDIFRSPVRSPGTRRRVVNVCQDPRLSKSWTLSTFEIQKGWAFYKRLISPHDLHGAISKLTRLDGGECRKCSAVRMHNSHTAHVLPLVPASPFSTSGFAHWVGGRNRCRDVGLGRLVSDEVARETEPWMYLSSFSTFHFFHRQHVFFLLRTLSEWT